MQLGLKGLVKGLVARSAAVRRVALQVYLESTYVEMRERFVANGEGSPVDPSLRRAMVRRFEAIDRDVPTATTPTDGLLLAEALLSVEAPGDVVECGCFNGASTAKLSIVANALGRKLHVFDSFEGLPEVDAENLRDHHARYGRVWTTEWKAGRYAAAIERVKGNVQRYGEIGVCTFVKGWFSRELFEPNLPPTIALAFVDVDIPSSARECIRAIWPRLPDRGVFFSHDIAYIKVLQEFFDRGMWGGFQAFPPIPFGAGFGYGEYSPHLGFMVKGAALTAEYIKSLTMEK